MSLRLGIVKFVVHVNIASIGIETHMLHNEEEIEGETFRSEKGLGKITRKRGEIALCDCTNDLLGDTKRASDNVQQNHGKAPSDGTPPLSVQKQLGEVLDDGTDDLDLAGIPKIDIPIQAAQKGGEEAHDDGDEGEGGDNGDALVGGRARGEEEELQDEDCAHDGAVRGEEDVVELDLRGVARGGLVRVGDGRQEVRAEGEDGVGDEANDVDGHEVGGQPRRGAALVD